jgi:CheY-like chemotaxis protein
VLLIALTGWGQDHNQDRARAAGFDHHMIKPPNLEMLRNVLSRGWNGDRGLEEGDQ